MSQARAYDVSARDWRQEQERMSRTQMAKERRRAETLRNVLVLCGVLVTFVALFGLMMLKVTVYKAQMELQNINDQIAAAELETSRLEAVLNEQCDINRIMTEAEALGMGSPAAAQVIRTEPADQDVATMSK